MSRIVFTDVTFAYPNHDDHALDRVSTAVPSGDIVLVVGASGSGKSTLLRAINGLVPHHTGGRFSGDVSVGGLSTRDALPRDLAATVGFVHQDPEAQFVTDRVESDVAFALENLGLDATAMRRRVEEVFDALGIAHLRDRHPGTLSGGEQQRCAIAGAIASGPPVLVLDEPTSQLDPQGAESVLMTIAHLNQELGTTVMMAEHRLERAAPIADRAIAITNGRVSSEHSVAAVVGDYEGAPSVVRLAALLGWDPVPLTVRDARRALEAAPRTLTPPPPADMRATPGDVLLSGERLGVTYQRFAALHPTDFSAHAGEVTVLLGRNGAGKSTLLKALAGLASEARGTVHRTTRVAYVPQNPNTLLFARTVRAELAETLKLLGRSAQDPAIDAWLARLGLESVADANPRDLSGGQRQRVAIAAVAVGGADVLLLDEPTRGIDAPSRQALERAIREHCAAGGAVVLATHDVELAARVADRAVVLADSEVIADGPAAEVLGGSLFAPQVARILPGYLTVEAVADALDRSHP